DVVFDEVVVDVRARGAVGVQRVAIAAGHDAIRDRLDAGLVLGVDRVPVTAVGAGPAVVVDNAAVQLAVGGRAPEADSLAVVVDHQVDVLAPLAGIDVQPAPGAVDDPVTRIRRHRLGGPR